MKSFVEYPQEFEKLLFSKIDKSYPGKLLTHLELYKKVSNCAGDIVCCGIGSEEEFTQLAGLGSLVGSTEIKKIISFERFSKNHCFNNPGIKELEYAVVDSLRNILKKDLTQKIEFVPGDVSNSIPEYLMENPEMKISCLSIDFDDYESTLTTLEFFYPRLVHGGILIFDNYYKKEDDYAATRDYFKYMNTKIYSYSVNKGPHYLVRL